MPANLTPAYKAAEAAYKEARDPKEQLDCLREMLRTIPKHKGTEHLQADIKTKIKELTDELAGPRKTGARTGPVTVIHPEGAAQVALVGPPNTGKSTLHARVTGSHAKGAPYPLATQYPLPGMLPYEDVGIQLVDLPSITPTHPIPWIGNSLQPADGALLVTDLNEPGCVEAVLALQEILTERSVALTPLWDGSGRGDDLFTKYLPTVLVVNKIDTTPHWEEELEVFRELSEVHYPVLAVSAETGEGLDRLAAWLFRNLGIVRVYTKIPGEEADHGRPYTLRAGQTVHDVALLVHRDIAGSLKYARLWGGANYEGQQVGADHVLADGDVVELHA